MVATGHPQNTLMVLRARADTLLDMDEELGRWTDPAYRAGVIDLLGALAYGELSAFLRLASDAELAPALASKSELSRLAVIEFQHYELLTGRLTELGLHPDQVMAPFVAPIDEFHARTTPSTWHEGLVKYFVGDAIAADFYREISAHLDEGTRKLVLSALDTSDSSQFAVSQVSAAVAGDPVLASRRALWGRRRGGAALIAASGPSAATSILKNAGSTVAQERQELTLEIMGHQGLGQRVAADRDALSVLVMGSDDSPGMGLAGIVEMFGRITERHTQRMAELGLSA